MRMRFACGEQQRSKEGKIAIVSGAFSAMIESHQKPPLSRRFPLR